MPRYAYATFLDLMRGVDARSGRCTPWPRARCKTPQQRIFICSTCTCSCDICPKDDLSVHSNPGMLLYLDDCSLSGTNSRTPGFGTSSTFHSARRSIWAVAPQWQATANLTPTSRKTCLRIQPACITSVTNGLADAQI